MQWHTYIIYTALDDEDRKNTRSYIDANRWRTTPTIALRRCETHETQKGTW